MQHWPTLKFPPIRPRARRVGTEIEVWDVLRGLWLKLTPEEWVRRHLLQWLISSGVPAELICQEYPVFLHGQPQRADVVVADRRGAPWLLAECKAPEVALSLRTLDQLIRYNSVLGARYLMITNGLDHRFYFYDKTEYRPMNQLPAWSELLKNE